MKVTVVNISDILKHPTMRMDAAYHVGKAEGKKAYKVMPGGTFVEDDTTGKVMMFEKDAIEYNDCINKIAEIKKRVKTIKDL